VDLRERRQLDLAEQMAKVKARTRPWRSIILLILALAAAVAVLGWGHPLLDNSNPADHRSGEIITYAGAAACFALGMAATFGLSAKAREMLRPAIGLSHAGIIRYALVLLGAFILLLISLDLANLHVRQLVLGGVVTGVLLGIAAQQSLANLFAGLVLLFARPFRVGDRVLIRSGALGGPVEGTVTDISLTYVRVEGDAGRFLLPNSLVLAAAVAPLAPTGPEQPPAL
jgi:small-conductance mechanosensitive channel